MRGRLWPFLLSIAALFLTSMVNPVYAVDISVKVISPRPAGWILGDIVPVTIEIYSPGATLQESSLPHPGPLNYWLDLRSLDVQKENIKDSLHYTLTFHYQTFYVPLDVNQRQIPALDLLFRDGAKTQTISVSPQTFFMSPLRGVAHSGMSLEEQIQADVPAKLIDNSWLQKLVAGLGVLCVLWLIALAIHYSLWPFHQRQSRPLAKAYRAMKRQLHGSAPEAYRSSMLVLHRALDETNNGRLLAGDVMLFLQKHAALTSSQNDLEQFFAASADVFFGDNEERAKSVLPGAGLLAIAKRLARAERERV